MPSIDGLKDVPFLDSTSIMELDRVPEHLLVLGGGYVGLEFGQLFRRLGAKVTIVQSGEQLLAREDADVAEEVAKILREDKIEVLLNTRAERVKKVGKKIAADAFGREKAAHDHRLASADRDRTRSQHRYAESVRRGHCDRQTELHFRERTSWRRTSTASTPLATSRAGRRSRIFPTTTFRILNTNVLEKGNASTDGRLVPYTVFIDPQLGRIGMTEAEAREQKREIRVAKMPMNYVARALEVDETRGFMKAIVDAKTDQILGAAVLGIEGGEIMSQIQIAMMGKLPFTALRDGVFAHPTLAESLNNLFTHFE